MGVYFAVMPQRASFKSEHEYKVAAFEYACGWNDMEHQYPIQNQGFSKWYLRGVVDYKKYLKVLNLNEREP